MDERRLIYPPVVPGVMDKEIVATIKDAGFPRFSKQLMSECRKAEKTGVCLQPEAVEVVCQKYDIPPPAPPATYEAVESHRKKQGDGHRFTYRAGCRLSDEQGAELEQHLRDDPNYQDKTDLVRSLVLGYIKRKRREATKKKNKS